MWVSWQATFPWRYRPSFGTSVHSRGAASSARESRAVFALARSTRPSRCPRWVAGRTARDLGEPTDRLETFLQEQRTTNEPRLRSRPRPRTARIIRAPRTRLARVDRCRRTAAVVHSRSCGAAGRAARRPARGVWSHHSARTARHSKHTWMLSSSWWKRRPARLDERDRQPVAAAASATRGAHRGDLIPRASRRDGLPRRRPARPSRGSTTACRPGILRRLGHCHRTARGSVRVAAQRLLPPIPGMDVICRIHSRPDPCRARPWREFYASRRLAHSHRGHGRYWVEQRRSVDEHEFDVLGETAAAEAPPLADSVIRHAPLDGSLKVGQRLGGKRVHSLGDVPLRLRKAREVGKDRFVSDRRLCRTCPAGHGLRQRRGRIARRRPRRLVVWITPTAVLHAPHLSSCTTLRSNNDSSASSGFSSRSRHPRALSCYRSSSVFEIALRISSRRQSSSNARSKQ